jgi:hypothetical protein
MFNIANEITVKQLNTWIENNKNALNRVDGCYTLDIAQILLDTQPIDIFTGSTREEIFTKMYDYCLKNGLNLIDLLNYPNDFNHRLIVNNLIKEIDGKYYTRDFSKIWESDFTMEKYGFFIELTKDNINIIEDAVISLIFDVMNYDSYQSFNMQKHNICVEQ